MNKQEIFDFVLNHMRNQGSISYDEENSTCAYRNKDGKKCAIGCLIPDDCYMIGIEGESVTTLFQANIVDDYPDYFNLDNLEFLQDLQNNLHDDLILLGFDKLEQNARKIAKKYNLIYANEFNNLCFDF